MVACAEDGTVYTREGNLEGRYRTEPLHISGLREWRPDIGILGHSSSRALRPQRRGSAHRLGAIAQ